MPAAPGRGEDGDDKAMGSPGAGFGDQPSSPRPREHLGSGREGVKAAALGCPAGRALPRAPRRAPGHRRRMRAGAGGGTLQQGRGMLFNGGSSLLPLACFAGGRGERAVRKD